MMIKKTCLILLLFKSFFVYCADSGYEVGSPKFYDFLKQQGVHYTKSLNFVQALWSEKHPGGLLYIQRQEINDPEIKAAFLNKEIAIVTQEKLPVLLEASVKPVPEIKGHGLFAAKNFHVGDLLGIYAGEVSYAPLSLKKNDDTMTLNILKTKEIENLLGSDTQAAVLGDYEELIRSRYVMLYMKNIPTHETDPIAVNASKRGNELRFVNHGSGADANCEMMTVLLPAWEFFSFSNQKALSNHMKTESPDVYIPIPVLKVIKEIKNGQEFLFDYGDFYFNRLKIEPIKLTSDFLNKAAPVNACAVCKKDACTKQCSRCKAVYYCGVECQKKDWMAHKGMCKKT